MGNCIRFLVLLTIKVLARTFYRFEVTFVGDNTHPVEPFRNVRLVMILNHTSLYEPIFFGAIPNYALWDIASRGVLPGADITVKRPFVGSLYKLLVPQLITVTRRRDATWTEFLAAVKPDSIILIAPEGRMKRPNGLDKDGKPFTIRGGVADLLGGMKDGKLLIGYSGGLHHVQVPGQRFPKLFKKLQIAFEVTDIADYKNTLGVFPDRKRFIQAVVYDLEARRERHCPGGFQTATPNPSPIKK
jgi:1-acyl-sn-glycerol-3-phosphate acyltransferase